MQINTYENKVLTKEVTKSYTDFQTTDPLNTIDITTFTNSQSIIGVDVQLSDAFGGIQYTANYLTIDDGVNLLVDGMRINSNQLFGNITNVEYKNSIWNCNIDPTMLLGDGVTRNLIDYPLQITSTKTIKATVYSEGLRSWSMGPDMRYALRYIGGCGDQPAALCVGGQHESGSVSACHEFDGTSWSQGGLTSSLHSECGATGNLLGALVIAGNSIAVTEEYNGTAWSSGGSLSQTNNGMGCFGTQGSAVCAGGYNGGSAFTTTEEYNGTSWSAGGSLLSGRRSVPAFGAGRSAGIIAGGYNSTILYSTEEYDGNVWASSLEINSHSYGTWGCGSTNSGLIHGPTGSQEYDGTNWSHTGHSNIYRSFNGLAGSRSHSITFGGYGFNERLASSELYDIEVPRIPVWSVTGGSVNTLRNWIGSCGSQTAGLEFGGWTSGATASDYTNEYDGTTWASANAMGIAVWQLTGAGTQTAAVHMGGTNSASNKTATCEEYNGTNWSYTGDINTVANASSGFGTQSAAMKTGGNPLSSVIATVEEYNGATWSAGTSLNIARYVHGSCGTQSAGLVEGGTDFSDVEVANELWNGASWSTESFSNMQKGGRPGTTGLSNAAISAGGTNNAGSTDDAEIFDGSTWTTIAGLVLARRQHACCGGTTAAVMAHGTDGNFLIKESENYDDPATNDLSNLTQGTISFTFKYIDYSGS